MLALRGAAGAAAATVLRAIDTAVARSSGVLPKYGAKDPFVGLLPFELTTKGPSSLLPVHCRSFSLLFCSLVLLCFDRFSGTAALSVPRLPSGEVDKEYAALLLNFAGVCTFPTALQVRERARERERERESLHPYRAAGAVSDTAYHVSRSLLLEVLGSFEAVVPLVFAHLLLICCSFAAHLLLICCQSAAYLQPALAEQFVIYSKSITNNQGAHQRDPGRMVRFCSSFSVIFNRKYACFSRAF